MIGDVIPEFNLRHTRLFERGISRLGEGERLRDPRSRHSSQYLRDIIIVGSVVALHIPSNRGPAFQGILLLLFRSTKAVGEVVGSTTLKGKPQTHSERRKMKAFYKQCNTK